MGYRQQWCGSWTTLGSHLPTIFPEESSSDAVFPTTMNLSGSRSVPASRQAAMKSRETTGMPHLAAMRLLYESCAFSALFTTRCVTCRDQYNGGKKGSEDEGGGAFRTLSIPSSWRWTKRLRHYRSHPASRLSSSWKEEMSPVPGRSDTLRTLPSSLAQGWLLNVTQSINWYSYA